MLLGKYSEFVGVRSRDTYSFLDHHNVSHLVQSGFVYSLSGSLGSGKTKALFRFISKQRNKHVLWIEEQMTIYPPLLASLGGRLDQIFFLETPQIELAAMEAIRLEAFDIVVISETGFQPKMNSKSLSKLSLWVRSKEVLVFHISNHSFFFSPFKKVRHT